MGRITSYLAIVFLGIAAVLWPGWLRDGYLEDWYPRIGTFIAIYGGLIGNIVWLILDYRNNKK
jgi:hypothetical protein